MITTFESKVDNYLPDQFRNFIEAAFYAKVSQQAQLENLKADPLFKQDPLKHIGLYTDHGVVHVRDVALQALEVIQTVNGVLIPKRNKTEIEFLKAYTLQLVYLHDIGMADFTAFGRFMHPEFAAQYIFQPDFSSMVDHLWEVNAGNIPWKLIRLFGESHSTDRLKLIYRELLALSMGHSKSKMPIEEINDPERLRDWMLNVLSTSLKVLFYDQKMIKQRQKLARTTDADKVKQIEASLQKFMDQKSACLSVGTSTNDTFLAYYEDYETEAYRWLLSEDEAVMRMVVDIQDCIRIIRAADALRQRGTVLRTSAGYEIFIDRKTANAIYALRDRKHQELYLLEGEKSVNAGEANLASSELDADGNLRVSFHVGAFFKHKITHKAAKNAALTIDDIQADVLQSFLRDASFDRAFYPVVTTDFADIQIIIEATDDNPAFAKLVCKYLEEINPAIYHRLKTAISLQGADLEEVQRFVAGKLFNEIALKPIWRRNLRKSGIHLSKNKSHTWLADVRIIQLHAGETLIESGSPSGFVYIPISEGLRVYPLGGYESQPASPWIPIGNTGVIRGSVRNAKVVAEQEVELISIPKSIYLEHCYRPYSPKRLFKNWDRNSVY